AGSSYERRLRRSGMALRDLVPAYMIRADTWKNRLVLYPARLVLSLHRAEFIPLLTERMEIRSTTNLPSRGMY
ncbi:MAG: hypothetical protein NTY19_24850, partial [Planctomycetota bacterium]|nr:hypothetical protein [Planctomycetota bacterium]